MGGHCSHLPWKDNSGASFERLPSSCLKGNSSESQTGRYKETYPMPRVSPLPFKGPLSFCLCLGSYQLSFPLCILWEHSSLQLPAFCHGIFLSSNPVRFVSSSAYLMMAQFSGLLQDSCVQSWQSRHHEHWQMPQISLPRISPAQVVEPWPKRRAQNREKVSQYCIQIGQN